MDEDELRNTLTNNQTTKPFFKGVFSSDELPWFEKDEILKNKFIILNLDKRSEPGSHWVCIMLHPCNKNLFFDSYGMLPQNSDFEEFMNKSYSYNSTVFQHDLTTTCGQWCIYFIYHVCSGLPLTLLKERFPYNDKLLNDYLVNTIVQNKFNIQVPIINHDFVKARTNSTKQCCTVFNPLKYH